MNTRKTIAIILALMLFALPLFAVNVSVTWDWVNNDTEVKYFRYQVDGEAADGWTVVSSDVTSYEAKGLDGDSSYTLYLQQSYDGIYWSASSAATSAPMNPPVEESVAVAEVGEKTPAAVESVEAVVSEAPVAEQAPVEAAPAEAITEAAAVEAVPAEAPAAEKEPSAFQFTLGLGGGVGSTVPEKNLRLDANLSLDFENIVKSGAFGFDIRTDFGVLLDPRVGMSKLFKDFAFIKPSSYDKAMYADLMLGVNATVGKNMFYLAGGPVIQANWKNYDKEGSFGSYFNDTINLKWGIVADLGYRFNFTELFSLGLEARYSYLFDDLKNHKIDGRIMMGFTF